MTQRCRPRFCFPNRLAMLRRLAAVLLFLLVPAAAAQPAPEPLAAGLTVRPVAEGIRNAVRLVHDPLTDRLCYLTVEGAVDCLARPFGSAPAVRAYDASDHGLGYPALGLAVADDGTLYVVGNEVDAAAALTAGVVMRGRPAADGTRAWSVVARTEPYPRSNTAYDHNFSGVAVSPDGAHLYVNSGSRTDHGEVQDAGGRYPGLREAPLTSAVFRLPADADDLLLPNDEAALRAGGYLFADGTRNSFSLAFDAAGVLFGVDNAGDRDDPEELNALVEGAHYGFPWRSGTAPTPQATPGYDPAADALLNPAAGAVQAGFFHDDPAFPPPPTAIPFTDPLPNAGPDADLYRTPDGRVADASAEGRPLGTFTPHRSPLGLVFDAARTLPAGYAGDGFVLSWTDRASPLLAPFGDEGEDLVHLRLEPTADSYTVHATRLVRGFDRPIDAALVDGRLYVIEFGEAGRLWEVGFGAPVAAEAAVPTPPFAVEVYPHPAAHATRVVVTPERTERMTLDVYTLLGQHVLRLHDGMLAGGAPHALALDARRLAPGVYVLRVRGARAEAVRRLTVVGGERN